MQRHSFRLVQAATLLLTFALHACTSAPQAPEAPATYTVVTLETTAGESIAAAHLTLVYDPSQAEFGGVRASDANANLMARSFNDGDGTVTVGLVAASNVSGSLVQVAFKEGAPTVEVELHSMRAYRSDESDVRHAIRIQSVRSGQEANPTEGYDATELSFSAAIEAQGVVQPADLELQPEFANYPLGDLTRSGELDVLDVLRVLHFAVGSRQPHDSFEWYHADLNSDGAIDVVDVKMILDKAIDPTLEASLQVAPRLVTFEQVHLDRSPILIGNAGNEPLSLLSPNLSPSVDWSLDVVDDVGLADHSAAYQVDVAPGWKNGVVTFSAGPTESQSVLVGNIALLIVGQSNATGFGELTGSPVQGIDEVRLFRNDFEWLEAYEPIHDNTGQVACASYQDQTPQGCDVAYNPDPGHSFAVELSKQLHGASGRYIYLVPAAKGGSALWSLTNPNGEWWPPAPGERLDRATLFGNANFRAHVSAGWDSDLKPDTAPLGGPVSAIVWYQGESEATQRLAGSTFVSRTNHVMDAFTEELYAPPILYVQLGRASTDYGGYDHLQEIREYQRRMETDHGQTPRADFFMVVAHDLPMIDRIHLSAEGQRILGERLALAYRQHVLGDNVNGTGPRLQSLAWAPGSSTAIDVTLDVPVNASTGNYSNYFHVKEDSGDTNLAEAAHRIGDRVIRITLSREPGDDVTLSYEPPVADQTGKGYMADVVRDDDGLPLPAFGPLPVATP